MKDLYVGFVRFVSSESGDHPLPSAIEIDALERLGDGRSDERHAFPFSYLLVIGATSGFIFDIQYD
jgi:hypothetical protein